MGGVSPDLSPRGVPSHLLFLSVGDSVLRSDVAGRQVTSVAAHALGFDDYRLAAVKRAMTVAPVRRPELETEPTQSKGSLKKPKPMPF